MFKMRIKKTYLILFSFIFVFFTSMTFLILKYPVNVATISIITCYILFLCFNFKKECNFLIKSIFSKNLPFIWLVAFLLISSFFTLLFLGGNISFKGYFFWLIAFLFQIFFMIYIPYNFVYKYISNNDIYRMIILVALFVFIMGCVDIISDLANITVFKLFLSYFHTRWLYMNGDQLFKIYVNGFPRLQSIFDEPSHVGWFITMLCPFIYSFCLSKKSFFNEPFNKFLKIFIIPFMFLILFLTFSPTMIIFTFIITFFYFYFLFPIRKRIVILIISLLSVFSFLIIINTDNFISNYSVFNRIHNSLSNIDSIDSFITADLSLGTRICVSLNNIVLAIKHPIIGVGWGQISIAMNQQLLNSPVILTPEVVSQHINKGLSYCGFLYRILAETGFICTTIFLMFFVSLQNANLLMQKVVNKNEKMLLYACFYSTISVLIMLFYDIPFNNTLTWFLIGLNIAITQKLKKKYLK